MWGVLRYVGLGNMQSLEKNLRKCYCGPHFFSLSADITDFSELLSIPLYLYDIKMT